MTVKNNLSCNRQDPVLSERFDIHFRSNKLGVLVNN